jgi:hypothetical protein
MRKGPGSHHGSHGHAPTNLSSEDYAKYKMKEAIKKVAVAQSVSHMMTIVAQGNLKDRLEVSFTTFV